MCHSGAGVTKVSSQAMAVVWHPALILAAVDDEHGYAGKVSADGCREWRKGPEKDGSCRELRIEQDQRRGHDRSVREADEDGAFSTLVLDAYAGNKFRKNRRLRPDAFFVD